ILRALDGRAATVAAGPEGPAPGRSVGDELPPVPRGEQLVVVVREVRRHIVFMEPESHAQEHDGYEFGDPEPRAAAAAGPDVDEGAEERDAESEEDPEQMSRPGGRLV